MLQSFLFLFHLDSCCTQRIYILKMASIQIIRLVPTCCASLKYSLNVMIYLQDVLVQKQGLLNAPRCSCQLHDFQLSRLLIDQHGVSVSYHIKCILTAFFLHSIDLLWNLLLMLCIKFVLSWKKQSFDIQEEPKRLWVIESCYRFLSDQSWPCSCNWQSDQQLINS